MDYQAFSTFTYPQITATKTRLNKIIDQNYRHRLLDRQKQSEYDSLAVVLADLATAEQRFAPRLIKIA